MFDVSLVLERGILHVDPSPGRLIRPVLIVDIEKQELVIDQLYAAYPDHEFSIEELVSLGALEYLSPWEGGRTILQ